MLSDVPCPLGRCRPGERQIRFLFSTCMFACCGLSPEKAWPKNCYVQGAKYLAHAPANYKQYVRMPSVWSVQNMLLFFFFSLSSYTKRSPHYSKHSWNYTIILAVILHPEKSQRNIRLRPYKNCVDALSALSVTSSQNACNTQTILLTVVNKSRCIKACYVEDAFSIPNCTRVKCVLSNHSVFARSGYTKESA